MCAGIIFRLAKTLPADAHKGINAWVIYLALPAVSFKYLPSIQWSSDLLLPLVSPIVVWLGAWCWIHLYVRKSGLDKASEGGLKLVAGLSNTSFLGFPLVTAYFGEANLGIAVICDQVTFTLLSTAGLLVAINSSQKHELSVGLIVKKVVQFPPFLGCVGALVIPHFVDLTVLSPLFDRLASTVGPLALFSIGLQLHLKGWKSQIRPVSIALFYKLLIAPTLVALLFMALGMKGTTAQVTLFEAAMPTLVSSGIVAEHYHLNPDLANLVIGVGIVLSFSTTFLWWLVIKGWF